MEQPFVKVAIPFASVAVMRKGASSRGTAITSVPVLEPVSHSANAADGLLVYTRDQRIHVFAEFWTPAIVHIAFGVLDRYWRRVLAPPPPYVPSSSAASSFSANGLSAPPAYAASLSASVSAPPQYASSVPVAPVAPAYAPPVPPRPAAAAAPLPGRDFESDMRDNYRNNPFLLSADPPKPPVEPWQPPPPHFQLQQQQQQPQVQSSASSSVYPQSPFSNPYSK